MINTDLHTTENVGPGKPMLNPRHALLLTESDASLAQINLAHIKALARIGLCASESYYTIDLHAEGYPSLFETIFRLASEAGDDVERLEVLSENGHETSVACQTA